MSTNTQYKPLPVLHEENHNEGDSPLPYTYNTENQKESAAKKAPVTMQTLQSEAASASAISSRSSKKNQSETKSSDKTLSNQI